MIDKIEMKVDWTAERLPDADGKLKNFCVGYAKEDANKKDILAEIENAPFEDETLDNRVSSGKHLYYEDAVRVYTEKVLEDDDLDEVSRFVLHAKGKYKGQSFYDFVPNKEDEIQYGA